MKVTGRRFLVTGGTGFIGAALARRLSENGGRVRVFDNGSRGARRRLGDAAAEIEVVEGDIRDPAAVEAALSGMDCVWHLAYVNGTRYFYEQPELVLDVGVKGVLNVVEGCARRGVAEVIVASSSEVYQTAPVIPTDETVPLSIPDVLNPRYSYAGGKILSELIALNYGRTNFERVLVFRPHNVYGPDMGWEHVIPELVVRTRKAIDREPKSQSVDLQIQGSGTETRAFVHIDDLCDALLIMYEAGKHLNIYHAGNDEEIAIADLARRIGTCLQRTVNVKAGPAAAGAPGRRCPNIAKLRSLGFSPRRPLAEGLPPVVEWYDRHVALAPQHLQ